VAGYNVEFGGIGFSLLALAEYRNMFFMRILTAIIFFRRVMGYSVLGDLIIAVIVVMIRYFVVWVRGVVPRFRYDLLIKLCWQILLVIRLALLIFYSCVLVRV